MLKRKIKVDALLLIHEVKKHPCLWDYECRTGIRKASSIKAWISITGKLKTPAADLRSKWKNLKDAYRKELKKNFIDGEYKGLWKYFDALDFLRDSVSAGERGGEVEEWGSDQPLQIDNDIEEEVQEAIDAHALTGRVDRSVIRLILTVKKHECLWNKDFPKKSSLQAKTWLEVSNRLGRKVNDVQMKWRNLKSAYKREVSNNFLNGEYRGKWQYFHLMSFVKVVVYIRNFDDPHSDHDESENSETKDGIVESVETEIETALVNNVDYLDNEENLLPEKRQKVEDDEYDIMFLKSLAPFFRDMDNVRKLALRSKIQDMVMNEIANRQSKT